MCIRDRLIASGALKKECQLVPNRKAGGQGLSVQRTKIKFGDGDEPVGGEAGDGKKKVVGGVTTVSYTHLRAHETVLDLVCRLLLEKKKNVNMNELVKSEDIMYKYSRQRSMNTTRTKDYRLVS
eukprot:TRINITY_DN24773_c0_g1_i1.p1 TRINITY_DN24773_c0_g1~~TRINITY_DN24773_c0_g1_i1.p1  ORF type:complete len:124 (-),score=39.08 TRINITY_DN24773_c0_g1_i1:11-382(-)